jgi:hypothetical protein
MHIFADIAGLSNDRALLCQGPGPSIMARLQDWRANEPFRSRLHAQPKVIAYQQTGRVEEARRTAEQLIAARLNFTIDAWLKAHFRRDMARVEADTAAPARRRLPLG